MLWLLQAALVITDIDSPVVPPAEPPADSSPFSERDHASPSSERKHGLPLESPVVSSQPIQQPSACFLSTALALQPAYMLVSQKHRRLSIHKVVNQMCTCLQAAPPSPGAALMVAPLANGLQEDDHQAQGGHGFGKQGGEKVVQAMEPVLPAGSREAAPVWVPPAPASKVRRRRTWHPARRLFMNGFRSC